MKITIALLALLLVILQYRFWLGDGGLMEVHRLEERVARLQDQVKARQDRNRALEAEVLDLKKNLSAVEERARRDLGMIKKGETYVMVIEKP